MERKDEGWEIFSRSSEYNMQKQHKTDKNYELTIFFASVSSLVIVIDPLKMLNQSTIPTSFIDDDNVDVRRGKDESASKETLVK